MKKIITTGLLSISTCAVINTHAAELQDVSRVDNKLIQAAPATTNTSSRFYVSGQVGYADTGMQAKFNTQSASGLSNDGLAGRLAMGYRLNPNVAIELGYLQLQQATLRSANLFLNQNAFDLTGKAALPIAHNVNLYGKLGVAYLTTKIDDQSTNINGLMGIAKRKWAPEAALGIAYDITSNVTVDTSFTHIQPLGNNRPGNIDFLAVGVGYNFG